MSKQLIDIEGLKIYHDKVVQALNEKADNDVVSNIKTDLNSLDTTLKTKADKSDVYTRQEADDKYCTKAHFDQSIAEKADATDVYTRQEADDKYCTKAHFDQSIAEKADATDVYDKAQTDQLLDNKADKAIVVSLGEKVTTVELDIVDKANKSDVYTKEEVDAELANCVNYIGLTTTHYTSNLGSEGNPSVYDLIIKMIALFGKSQCYVLCSGYISGLYYVDIRTKGQYVSDVNIFDVLRMAKYDNTIENTNETSFVELISNHMATAALADNVYTKEEVDSELSTCISYLEFKTTHYSMDVSEENHTVASFYSKMIELCGKASSYVMFSGYITGLYYIDIQYMGIYLIKVVDVLTLATYEGYVDGGTRINEIISNQMIARITSGNLQDLEERVNTDIEGLETTIQTLSNQKADATDIYTKTETDSLLENKADKAIVESLGEKVTTVELDIVDKADKSDVYTKEEVDDKIANAGGGSVSGDYLPLTGGTVTGEVTVTDTLIVTEEGYSDESDQVRIHRTGIVLPNNTGIGNRSYGNAIGFNDEGEPTILNRNGRSLYIATDDLYGDYNCYTFPEKSGTVVLTDDTGAINITDEQANSTVAITTHAEGGYAGITATNDDGIYKASYASSYMSIKGDGMVFEVYPEDGYFSLHNAEETNSVSFSRSQITRRVDGERYWYAYPDKEGTIALAEDFYTKEEVDDKIANSGGGSVSGDYLPLSGGTITGELRVGDGTNYSVVTETGIYVYGEGPEIFIGDNDEVCLTNECISAPSLIAYGEGITLNGCDINANNLHGLKNNSSNNMFGFCEEGFPTIVNRDGLYLQLTTTDPDEGYNCYYFPDDSGTVALTSDIPTYYMHTISITQAGGSACNLAFTVISKSSTAFTTSRLFSTYPSKAFACTGCYSSQTASKIAFTSSTQARVVYGATGTTATVTINTLSDTVIEVV